jgi:hypothetical protein
VLGVHMMTVSRWERGVLQPDRFRVMLLEALSLHFVTHDQCLKARYFAMPLRVFWRAVFLNSPIV